MALTVANGIKPNTKQQGESTRSEKEEVMEVEKGISTEGGLALTPEGWRRHILDIPNRREASAKTLRQDAQAYAGRETNQLRGVSAGKPSS